ncbi:MAG: sulfotransferase [Phycisphaerales bacterium]|nr:sulfotransferase [Phycisphaerales bacterium]
MTLPSFLIIGAMKSGTTTLYSDLATHPGISVPDHKEPGNLNHDEVLTPEGRAAYERNFRRCTSGQIAFEASTYYSMLPEHSGSAGRAHELLGSDLRVIYIVREPVARIRSHHQHMFDGGGAVDPDINKAVKQIPELIEYTLYRQQLEPWLERFSEDRIMVLHFESYMGDRRNMAAAVQRFLGLSPRPDLVRSESSANVSKGKRLNTGLSRSITSSALYRKMIRPYLPVSIRTGLKASVMKKSTTSLEPPSLGTVQYILDRTAKDVAAIAPLLHPAFPEGAMPWDPDELLSRASRGEW